MSEFVHRPVLPDAVVSVLAPGPGRMMVDLTLGGGGHASAWLDAAGEGSCLLGIDRDPDAIAAASARLARFGDRVRVVRAPFSQVRDVLEREGFGRVVNGLRRVDAVLFDIGVSSHQIDVAERGFSFSKDGPLDMRMAQQGETARELIERLDVDALARLLRELGEVPQAGRVARAIRRALDEDRITGTSSLATVVEAAIPASRKHKPATLVFQALRIAVNDELGELRTVLEQVGDLLDVGGVAGAITFHSLEDRMVKRAFRDLTTVAQPPRGVPVRNLPEPAFELVARGVSADDDEVAGNPRARSARLRAIRRVRFDGGGDVRA